MPCLWLSSCQAAESGADAFDSGGSITYVTTPLPGSWLARMMRIAAGTTQFVSITRSGLVTQRNYYDQFRFRYASGAAGTNLKQIWAVGIGGVCTLYFDANAKTLVLKDAAGATIATSAVLTADTWYVVEVRWRVGTTTGNGQLELRVNTTSVASSSTANCGTTAPTGDSLGDTVTSVAVDLFFSDFQRNDDQGTSNNTWPGGTQVGFLWPISDNARVGWTGGGRVSTTNLFQGVDNAPPTAIAIASATDATQIAHTANNATDTYDPNLGAYTTAAASGGVAMGDADIINAVQPMCIYGQAGTTAQSAGIQSLSNPVIAEAVVAGIATTAGTYPTGWSTRFGTISQTPTVTRGTSPVIRVRSATASATDSGCCLMGMIVAFTPVLGVAPPFATHRRGQYIHRLNR